jgi:hypothetical protein
MRAVSRCRWLSLGILPSFYISAFLRFAQGQLDLLQQPRILVFHHTG